MTINTESERIHPARQYLRDLPVPYAGSASPCATPARPRATCCPSSGATADDELESVTQQAFEMGRVHERYHAEQLRQAPAVGSLLKTMREALGLTVADVAEMAEVGAEWYERVEAGEQVLERTAEKRLTTLYD